MPETNADEVREQLRVLNEMFRRRLDDDLPELEKYADELIASGFSISVLTALNRALHKLAGSAGTFGFPEMGVAARSLEVRTQQWLQHDEPGSQDLMRLRQDVHGLKGHIHEDQAASAPSQTMPETPQSKSSVQILLVESDPALAQELTRAFGHFGYIVHHFQRLSEAAGAIQEHDPDVLILDVTFDDNGLNTIEQVALSLHSSDLERPIIFLCDRDNFEIRVQAARVGAGGFFRKPVDIPRLIDRVEQTVQHKKAIPFRLLIVDDDEELARHFMLVLRAAGMEVRVLTDPQGILETMEEFQPELILMDVTMPGYSGVDLARVIRMHEQWLSLPIVYLSAETDITKQLSAMSSGGDDFLTKPISDQHLVAAVSVRAARMRQLNELMLKDSLTGLLKHSRIKEQIALEFARSRRDQKPLCVTMLDIDHFKKVNDTYGHAVGDQVIKALAHLLKQRLRKTDAIGRYGGEEFAVAMPGCEVDAAMELLRDIRVRFKEIRFSAENEDFTVTLSAGVVEARACPDASALLVGADEALYRAKHNGRDQVFLGAARVIQGENDAKR
jgi:diguanylate cyclase (GGDEF)-like protein